MTLPLYLVHGWSYDRSFWAPMLAHLPDYTALCADHGYFGAPHTPPLPETPFLAISHSAGVLHLLAQQLPHCVGLIALNGFARFSAAPDMPHGVPARVISRMRRQLASDPLKTLQAFRAQCADTAPIPPNPNITQLDHGLAELETQDQRSQAAQWGERLFWLSGAQDPLAPAQAGFTTGHGITRDGGHLLPQEQPEHCADFIRNATRTLGYA